MKKSILKSLCMAAVALSAHSCLVENPKLTDDGQLGVDPTEVAVAVDINIDLTIPALEADGESFAQPATDGTAYKRRVVVEAATDGRLPVKRVMLLDIAAGQSELSVPVSLRLSARDYTLSVWSDYVQVADNGTVDSTYFYNVTMLPNVYAGKSYRGNNAYKDAAFASTRLDLSPYRNGWNERVVVDLPLQRPVGRLQLKATDTRAFLDRIASGQIKGESFAVRVSYPGYVCMGYNIAEQLPRHSLMYMTYDNAFSTKNMTADEPFLLTFDYLFAESDAITSVPMQIEILDSSKTTTLASCSFTANVRAGYCSTIGYGFLTSMDDHGITFDPNFSGNGTIVVVPTPSDNQ